MIERADSDYFAKLFVKAPAGFWHLHTKGIEPFVPQSVALGVSVAGIVRQGRWIVQCPHCAGAQLGAPDIDRFICVDCANVAVDGQWLRVLWPDDEGVQAIEAALVARPDVVTRCWESHETVGQLLFENMEHNLIDHDGERVLGDIGADQTRRLGVQRELSA